MKETELAEKILEYFSDYDLYQEVPMNGIIDIVAVKGRIITAIECKVNLNFDVMQQAMKNKAYSHFSYVAVPSGKNREFQYRVCKMLGIGVIEYNPLTYRNVTYLEKVKPALNRKIYKPKLHDWMKKSIAGSQNDRMTAFKNTLEEINTLLKRNGGRMEVKDVFSKNKYHYGTNTSARTCIVDLCRRGVVKQFSFENGFLISLDKAS